jgi:hypothetical protein
MHFIEIEARKKGAEPLPILLTPANPVMVASPATMGDMKVTKINVANVKDIMDYAPEEVFYQADVRINEGIASGANFMTDTAAMQLRMNVEVPLWGSATGIVLQDTMTVDLEQYESSDVTTASLKLDIVNDFPLGGNIQLVVTDENYEPITTLLLPEQTGIIQASTIDAGGELATPGEFNDLIELDESKIADLFKGKHLILMANLQTSRNSSGEATDVKFMSDYGLSVNIGLVAELKLTNE